MKVKTLFSIRLVALFALCALLSACGGGSGGGEESAGSERGSNNLAVSWNMPDSRLDGSDLPAHEIGGYLIHHRHENPDVEMGDVIAINDSQATDYTLSSLPSGTHYFAISAYDIDGIQSELSETVIAVLP